MDYQVVVAAVRRSQDEVGGKVAKHTYIVDAWDGMKPDGEYVACPYRHGYHFDITSEMDEDSKASNLQICGGCGAEVSGIIETRGEYEAD